MSNLISTFLSFKYRDTAAQCCCLWKTLKMNEILATVFEMTIESHSMLLNLSRSKIATKKTLWSLVGETRTIYYYAWISQASMVIPTGQGGGLIPLDVHVVLPHLFYIPKATNLFQKIIFLRTLSPY